MLFSEILRRVKQFCSKYMNHYHLDLLGKFPLAKRLANKSDKMAVRIWFGVADLWGKLSEL